MKLNAKIYIECVSYESAKKLEIQLKERYVACILSQRGVTVNEIGVNVYFSTWAEMRKFIQTEQETIVQAL